MDSKFNQIAQVSNSDNTKRKMISILSYNDDMLIEILLCLPAKSLIKFKSVCSHWLSLISTDQFCHLHTLRNPRPQPSLILKVHTTSQFFYLDPILNDHKQLIPYTFPIPNPKILSYCNGLLLLHSEKSYYVYNPTTRQSRMISLTKRDKYVYDLGLTLAFDPSVSSHYKIFCVSSATKLPLFGERCYQIEVYESESSMWKLCVESFTVKAAIFHSSGVYRKNVIHFYNYPLYLYFDIDKYVFGNMPPVPEMHFGAFIPFQESNGHLYHIRHVYSNHGDDSIEVYELQDDYSRWLMKYQDGLGQLPLQVDKLRFIRGDDDKTWTLLYHVSGKIMAYRFFDKRSEDLVDLTDKPFYLKDSEQCYSEQFYYSGFGESMAPV